MQNVFLRKLNAQERTEIIREIILWHWNANDTVMKYTEEALKLAFEETLEFSRLLKKEEISLRFNEDEEHKRTMLSWLIFNMDHYYWKISSHKWTLKMRAAKVQQVHRASVR